MAIPFHKNVTSIEAIAESIRTDRYVFRWFSHLIVQSQVKLQLKNIKNSEPLYSELAKVTQFHIISYIAFFVLLSILILTQNFWAVIPILISNFLMFRCSVRQKELVSKMSVAVLTDDFTPDQIGKMTLFHLTEDYAERYKIPSLVTTIYTVDRTLRSTLIGTFVFTCLIYQLKFWWALVWIIATFIVVRLILNLTVFYRNLK